MRVELSVENKCRIVAAGVWRGRRWGILPDLTAAGMAVHCVNGLFTEEVWHLRFLKVAVQTCEVGENLAGLQMD
jgi:hypothetical protein